ncbi:MAG: hypothetical protein PUC53_07525 [Bacteroidales bacterium]|nr:hypothetical protein [Bacteroidales bacterium]
MSDRKKIFKVITVILAVVICIAAVYIMANGLGLVEGLDFGAGAYYYADIPGFDKYVRDDAYDSQLPTWLAIVLFFVWGALMYALWKWVDRH